MVNGLKDNYTTVLIIAVLMEISMNWTANFQKSLRISPYIEICSVYWYGIR